MSGRSFVGFGLGPIQSGLFLYEAFRSQNFARFVVAEIDPALVEAVRSAGGKIAVNIAHADRIESAEISGIEILNPREPRDRDKLIAAIADADEIATALPSVAFYDRGDAASAVSCFADGFGRRDAKKQAVIYTAENDTRAAEHLAERLGDKLPPSIQVLNTVIGKMSGGVTGPEAIKRLGLAPMTADYGRAVLVEAFNRIQISRIHLPDFHRGISAFEEKDDLGPFEDAKLYGHNAVHALLGHLAHERRLSTMDQVRSFKKLLGIARGAFIEECGAGLRKKHAEADPLFSEAGWMSYAEDLLARMTNPFLRDSIARVIRDPQRKLGWDDRLIGAMRLALAAGVEPVRLARGVRLAMAFGNIGDIRELWPVEVRHGAEADVIVALVEPRG
jgi:mannitol-1-phosphate 5-dehydrogenase